MILFIPIAIILFAIAVFVFTQQPNFGKAPFGERLARIQQSPNYKNGQFDNLSHTPQLTEGANFFTILLRYPFETDKRRIPSKPLPTQKTNLHQLPPNQNVVVWFGHSSYFMQIDGKKFLIDPVLSGSASPIKSTAKAFDGTDVYKPEDIPALDYLFISHDHWDHLDHDTVLPLRSKVNKVICGLGTASHLEHWGYRTEDIIEKDWNEHVDLGEGFSVTVTPARHFSGRSFKRNQVLWVSFVLKTPSKKIYLGADSGYDTHFKTIGEQHGPFDLALLECGQYDKNWKYIHMMPEETIQAAVDLKAVAAMPVHWAKFALSKHAWDDSIKRASKAAKEKGVPIVTPMIGEPVHLDSQQQFEEWWKNL